MKAQKDYTLGFQLKKHKWATTVYVTTQVLHNVLYIAATFLVAYFLAQLAEGNFDNTVLYLIMFSSAYVLAGVTIAVSYQFYIYLVKKISLSIKTNLISRCFELTSKTFSEKHSGAFLTRINEDPDKLLRALNDLTGQIVEIMTFSVTIIYIMFVNWVIGLCLGVMLILLFIMESIRTKKFMKNDRTYKKEREKSTSLTTEIIRSEKDIKSINLENKLFQLAEKNYEKEANASYKTETVDTAFWTSRYVLTYIFSFVFLLIGIFLVKDTAISLASFLFIFTNKDSLQGVIWCYGEINKQIAIIRVSSSRMYEIFDEKGFPTEKFGSLDIEKLEGQIVFKNVNFGYTESDESEDKNEDEAYLKKSKKTSDKKTAEKELIPILTNLSFQIEKNQTVAFVGKSGSGKTTILNLISKLYNADSGEILLDGISISDFNKKSLRKHISLVNQFPYIFNATIRENLLMANATATEDEIIAASKQASLHDFVSRLKLGYDTKVGEGGIKLSGGQKQRLAIARALLRQSKIILFDESTSSLDNATQEEIRRSIENLGGSHTVVIVAHRLSTIKNANKIFFIEKGQIADSGTFKQLAAKNEAFKEFFQQEIEN